MTRHCSHLSDRSTGDGYVQANRSQAIKVKPNVQSRVIGWQNNFAYDVTIDAGISADGQRSGRCNTDGSFQNDCLIKAERDKYRKHEAAYANLSQGFLPFAVSSLGGMGDELLWFLFLLAKVEVDKMGLPSLSDQRKGFLRAKCFAASTARIGNAINKATAMRLMGVPSVPILPPAPRRRQGWIVYNLTDWLEDGSSWALS